MKTITLEMLTGNRACKDQVELFRELYGDAVSFETEAEAVAWAEKVATQFAWDWVAYHLLSDPAWAQYKKARDPALAEYKKAMAEFGRVCAHARGEYKKARAAACITAWFNDQQDGPGGSK